jgi:hypothetical protein
MTLSDVVDDVLRAQVAAGLETAQQDSVPPFRPRHLAILLRDAQDRLVGGLFGASGAGSSSSCSGSSRPFGAPATDFPLGHQRHFYAKRLS